MVMDIIETIKTPVTYDRNMRQLHDVEGALLGAISQGVDGQAIADALNRLSTAEAELAALRELLTRCRYALNFVPEEALGYGDAEDGHGGSYNWPIRDELTTAVDAAIKAAEEEKTDG